MYYFDHHFYDCFPIYHLTAGDIEFVNAALTERTRDILDFCKRSGHHGNFHHRREERNGFELSNPNGSIILSVIADIDWEEAAHDREVCWDCFEVAVLDGERKFRDRDVHRRLPAEVIKEAFKHLDTTDDADEIDSILFDIETDVWMQEQRF